MIEPIIIDASELQANFNIPDSEVKQLLSNIVSELAAEFLRYWEREANVLKSSKIQYKNSLYLNKIDNLNYEVGLTGWLPNAIEQGIEGFDEKLGFVRSSKRHEKIDGGWFLTIPFRHAISSAIGESEIFSGVMPSEVYSEAKKLGETSKQLDVKNLPSQYQIPKVRPTVVTKSKVFEEYQHKSSIYASMKRQIDSTGRGNYVTFRRVSDKSDENSWINTGIEARRFSEKALNNMNLENTVNALVEKYIGQLI